MTLDEKLHRSVVQQKDSPERPKNEPPPAEQLDEQLLLIDVNPKKEPFTFYF